MTGQDQTREGVPAAVPIAIGPAGVSVEVRGLGGGLRGTNSDAPSSPLSLPEGHSGGSGRRIGSRERERIRAGLSERDWRVIRLVAEHRYLTTAQVQRFAFTDLSTPASSERTTRRVLARLGSHGVLATLGRRVGGLRAGSSQAVWQITGTGARLLWDEHGHRTREPSPRFLDHCLLVAEANLTIRSLVHRAGDHPQRDDSIEGVEAEGAGVGIESVAVLVEPLSWRRYPGAGGEMRHLKPDLSAVVSTREYRDCWFIEIDGGTESLPTLLRKCEQYEAYYATGIEQHQTGTFPLVAWVMEGRRGTERSQRLLRALARSSRFTTGLYQATTLAGLAGLLRAHALTDATGGAS